MINELASKRDREAYQKDLDRRYDKLEEEYYEKWDYKVSEADKWGWQDESDRQEWEKFSAEVDKVQAERNVDVEYDGPEF